MARARARARSRPRIFNVAIVFALQFPLGTKGQRLPLALHHPFDNPPCPSLISTKGSTLWTTEQVRHHHSTSHISAILIVTHTGDYSVAAPGEDLQGESSFVDSSGPLFDMYLKMAQVEDEKRVESWKTVASDSLIFVSPNIVVHHMLTRLL